MIDAAAQRPPAPAVEDIEGQRRIGGQVGVQAIGRRPRLVAHAAHRLARNELTQAENESIYGKCARPHGHGHNYLVDVTVRGPIAPRSGMVCDLSALQRLVDDLVVEPFDHTFLNKDVPFFAECVPTAENIACVHLVLLFLSPPQDLRSLPPTTACPCLVLASSTPLVLDWSPARPRLVLGLTLLAAT